MPTVFFRIDTSFRPHGCWPVKRRSWDEITSSGVKIAIILPGGRRMLPDFEMIQHSFLGGHDITVVPISDVHLGSAECMEQEFMQFLETVRNTPDLYLTLGGDLIDNGTRSSVTNVFRATMYPSEQKRVMAKLLEPVRDRILCFVPGNHERRSGKDADDDPVYDIAAKLGFSYTGAGKPGEIVHPALQGPDHIQMLQTAEVRHRLQIDHRHMELFQIGHVRQKAEIIRRHVYTASVFVPEPVERSAALLLIGVRQLEKHIRPVIAALRPPQSCLLGVIGKMLSHNHNTLDLSELFRSEPCGDRNGKLRGFRFFRDRNRGLFNGYGSAAAPEHHSGDQRKHHCGKNQE